MKFEEFHENQLNLGKMRKGRPGAPRGSPRGSPTGIPFIIIPCVDLMSVLKIAWFFVCFLTFPDSGGPPLGAQNGSPPGPPWGLPGGPGIVKIVKIANFCEF